MPYLHDIRGSITNDWISKKKKKNEERKKDCTNEKSEKYEM